mmetsp:Transcript_16224/g.35172  ORF Transcript_16224/g.35172 Transcript_16224/m.35172 type:complete len:301 (-) Transcript_16224:2282-3184(-)
MLSEFQQDCRSERRCSTDGMVAFGVNTVTHAGSQWGSLDSAGVCKHVPIQSAQALQQHRCGVGLAPLRRGLRCASSARSDSALRSTATDSSVDDLPAPSPEATDARKLAQMLAGQWSNKQQAKDNPPFWSHIHVVFRPLPAGFFSEHPDAYAFYTESAYDYNLTRPYKNSVVRITEAPDGRRLELTSYKIEREPEEFFYAAHDRELLEDLTEDRLAPLSCDCNTVYDWDPADNLYRGYTRPGKKCRIGKGGYLWSQVTLKDGNYQSWDLGKDVETDERLWGAGAGPFDFFPVVSFAHEVP